jgi:hypothetical protein
LFCPFGCTKVHPVTIVTLYGEGTGIDLRHTAFHFWESAVRSGSMF